MPALARATRTSSSPRIPTGTSKSRICVMQWRCSARRPASCPMRSRLKCSRAQNHSFRVQLGVQASPEGKKDGPGSLENPKERRALCVGAEHRVRTGDLRLGNEHWWRARVFPTHHETARPVDFIRLSPRDCPPWLHGSPRGFSPFMCPICARLRHQNRGTSARRRSSCGAARLLDRARLPFVRTRRVASHARPPQRDQVRLRVRRPRSSARPAERLGPLKKRTPPWRRLGKPRAQRSGSRCR
jgi:hypothetical protein